MATLKAFRSVYAENANELDYTPPSGKAAIISDIMIVAANAGYATVKVENTTVGFFEIGPDVRNHLLLAPSDGQSMNVIGALKKAGLPCEFPVPQGGKVVISTTVTATYILMRYREVEPGDIKDDMPNAKNGKEFLRIYYGTNSADITTAGWNKLDKSLNPGEMHNWPFEEIANPFTQIDVYGVGFLDYEENTYTGSADVYGRTERLRFWKGTELLFNPNEDGFLVLGDGASAGSANKSYAGGTNELPYAGAIRKGSLFLFPTPVTFAKGDELSIEVKAALDADAQITAEELRCALFCKVTR